MKENAIDNTHNEKNNKAIDPDNNLFPFCIVWTPLSIITILFPLIGHTGICTSDGIIYDYGGDQLLFQDGLQFNYPAKYVPLEAPPNQLVKEWNETVINKKYAYSNTKYNLMYNNCHSYCAYVLNQMKYKGRSDYTMLDIFIMVTFKSKYISIRHFFSTYIGFIILFTMIIYRCLYSEF